MSFDPHGAASCRCATRPPCRDGRATRIQPGRATRQIQNPKSKIQNQRSAFTLVEMLVAVTVVIVMMTLFATIFQLATGAMGTQKGLAENDQRVRLVISMLRNDLNGQKTDRDTGAQKQTRTFRTVIPYLANESPGSPPFNVVTETGATPPERQGYFTISENNINDDTDDVLQLMVNLDATSSERLFGRTAVILPDATGNFGPAGTTAPTWNPPPPNGPYLPANPAQAPLILTPTAGNYWFNQPEFDDLLGTPNQAGSSTAAEVAYFLRNGTLYRRVMLVRSPNVTAPPDDHTPTNDAGGALSFTAYGNTGARNFWTDFDYSAYYATATGVQFFGIKDLLGNNGVATSLLSPANRWGFDYTSAAGAGYGLPRERDSNGTFIGRFTHAETSDPAFGYPGRFLAGTTNNPMAATTPVTLGGKGVVSQYVNGTRIGEDVLMTNVIAFDIKVWDPAASLGPDGQPGIAGFDDDGIPPTDGDLEIGAYGSDDGDWRDIGHPGLIRASGTYGFYCALNSKLAYYSNGGLVAGVPVTNRYDTWGPNVSISGGAGADSPPYRPVWAGPDGKPGVAGKDDDCDGTIDNASELGWPGTQPCGFPVAGYSSDDFAPLTAIKITIRFYDVTSNQVRDISEVFSLAYRQQ
jgi:type II secretory pathway pseudopilin PulG